MSVLLWAVLLAAAPVTLQDLPAVRERGRAARLVPSSVAVSSGKRCTFERRVFDDQRVTLQWGASCEMAIGLALYTAPHAPTIVSQFSQGGADPWLSFTAREAKELDPLKPPAWVKERQPSPFANGSFAVLAHDDRDGTLLARNYERGYVRILPGKTGPTVTQLFDAPWPGQSNTPLAAAFFDVDPAVVRPWLLYAVNPWQEAELRLRPPAGEERVLLQLPPRQSRSDYRVEALELLRTKPHALPWISVMIDGAHVLLTPDAVAHVFQSQAPGTQRPPLPGETNTPKANACSDSVIPEETESVFDPKLFEYRGLPFVVYLSEITHSSLRFGLVPRGGATPKDDAFTCDWLVDTRRAEVSVVVARITPDGHVDELVRTSVKLLCGRSQGSTIALSRNGDVLTALASSGGFVNLTVFDLAKLVPKN